MDATLGARTGAMKDDVIQIGDVRVLACSADGPRLAPASDVSDFISAAWAHRADLVAIPAKRLADDFFSLRTGLAGEAIQKFVNYRIRLAVVGDIARFTLVSASLRDFISESNEGVHVWFVSDMDELHDRLTS